MNKRRLLAAVGLATVALAVAYVARPVGHIPLYDANLIRLAESSLQGYCAGETFWQSAGEGSAEMASACRDRLADRRSNVPAVGAVPGAFCQAIVDQGWEGDRAACAEILTGQKLWPTYDGGITDQWNRARKYPGHVIPSGPGRTDDSRTGDRADVPRGAPER